MDDDMLLIFEKLQCCKDSLVNVLNNFMVQHRPELISNDDSRKYFQSVVFRLRVLNKCIHNVYDICPIESTNRVQQDVALDTTINLHCFILSIFGILDNLAWMSALELKLYSTKIRNKRQIGLFGRNDSGKYKYNKVREEFSEKLNNNLDVYEQWFKELQNFRHEITHRASPFVPPVRLTLEEERQSWGMLVDMNKSLKDRDYTSFDKIARKLDELGDFVAVLKSKDLDVGDSYIIHHRVLVDFISVIEIIDAVMGELYPRSSPP